jgi:Flp pilus assembly protein TadG
MSGIGLRRGRDGERGQALALFVIFLLVVLAGLALVVNDGILRRSNQELWNALDAGALAGAESLPGNPALAASDALKYALANHPGLGASSVNVSFRCLVGDRDGDGRPDAGDIPVTCNPGAGASWTCADGKCVAPCNPSAGQVCNTVVVDGTVATDFKMSGLTGVNGATTSYESAACAGFCGNNPVVPLDIGFILDRTSSMSDADLANVQDAALGTLQILDPSVQYVGLAVLGQSQKAANCAGAGNARGLAAAPGENGTWIVVPYPTNRPLANDYLLPDGSLNGNSQLVRTISCLNHSQTRTDLGDPLLAMANTLVNNGRIGVPKGIILMTDGAANMPDSRSCKYANDKATAVKNMGIAIYTIGFGVEGDTCVDIDGRYAGAPASRLLADMATGPTTDDGCTDAENADGDHYFCEPRTDSLAFVFKAAVTDLVQGAARLVSLPGS